MGRWEAPLDGSLARTRQNRKLRTFSDSLSTVCPPAWQVATSGRTGQAWITCQLSYCTNYLFPPPRRAPRGPPETLEAAALPQMDTGIRFDRPSRTLNHE